MRSEGGYRLKHHPVVLSPACPGSVSVPAAGHLAVSVSSGLAGRQGEISTTVERDSYSWVDLARSSRLIFVAFHARRVSDRFGFHAVG